MNFAREAQRWRGFLSYEFVLPGRDQQVRWSVPESAQRFQSVGQEVWMFSPVCSLSLSVCMMCRHWIIYIVCVDSYMTYVYHILYSKLTEGRTFMMAILRYSSALNHGWNWNGCLIKSTGCFQTQHIVAKSWVSEKSGLPMPMRSGVKCFCVKSGQNHIQRPSLSGKWKGQDGFGDSRLGKEDYWRGLKHLGHFFQAVILKLHFDLVGESGELPPRVDLHTGSRCCVWFQPVVPSTSPELVARCRRHHLATRHLATRNPVNSTGEGKVVDLPLFTMGFKNIPGG